MSSTISMTEEQQHDHRATGHPNSPASSRGNIVSDETKFYFGLIVDYWIMLHIASLGIVTNFINIAVFRRQGFKDAINISLTSIAIWDLIKCSAGVLYRLHGPLGLISQEVGIYWREAPFPFLIYVTLFSGYVSYALATYVSIERCLCVVIPFKVKSFFTPKFTLVMVTSISLFVFGAFSVMFRIYDVVFVFSPEYNTSIAEYVFNDFHDSSPAVMVYYRITSIVLPSSSFVVLCVSSAITVIYLKKSHEIHRKSSTCKPTADGTIGSSTISLREKQVVKTLLTVIMVYIGNLFPRIALIYIPGLIEPEYYVLKKYHNLFLVASNMVFILDYVNASVNLFIFLNMSSNFRSTFFTIFPQCYKHSKK